MAPFDSLTVALIFAIFVLAGFIKGAVAIGLPTVALVLLSQFLSVREAISLMLLPLFFSNLWLAIQGGQYLRTIKRYRYFIICQCLMMAVVAILTKNAPDVALRICLGTIIVIFSSVSLVGKFPELPAKYQSTGGAIFGTTAGMLGGLISAWAPSVVIYLSMLRVDKGEFARASGALITLGAIVLLASHFALGHQTLDNSVYSLLALIPSGIGMWLGNMLRQRISEKTFRIALYVVFLILGIEMVLGVLR